MKGELVRSIAVRGVAKPQNRRASREARWTEAPATPDCDHSSVVGDEERRHDYGSEKH
jgi:hypothetical protein